MNRSQRIHYLLFFIGWPLVSSPEVGFSASASSFWPLRLHWHHCDLIFPIFVPVNPYGICLLPYRKKTLLNQNFAIDKLKLYLFIPSNACINWIKKIAKSENLTILRQVARLNYVHKVIIHGLGYITYCTLFVFIGAGLSVRVPYMIMKVLSRSNHFLVLYWHW